MVKSHVAAVDGALVRPLIGVDALMREELVHALEHLHAFADGLAGFVRFWLEEVGRYVWEFALLNQLLNHWEIIRYGLSIPLCDALRCPTTPRVHMLNLWAMTLEESERLQRPVLLHMEHDEVIAVGHVQVFVIFAGCIEHVEVRVLLEVSRVLFWLLLIALLLIGCFVFTVR